MTAIKVTQALADDRLRVKIVSVDATPYVDCDNKNESLESLFKRCVILQADGTYALQVHYI
jgi:hypothetical protein